MNIIFMGTPEFAVPSLDILLKNNYTVKAVVTAVDKPAGRGKVMHESAVKKYAVSQNLKVLQPGKLKSEDFIDQLRSLKPDVIVVVAFRMLPEAVWKLPSKGTFNLHASLLPNYRGAAPINWAVMNGEKQTGVTTFFIDQEIDTGNILFYDKIDISDQDDAGIIHDTLMIKGAELVLKTVQYIQKGEIKPVKQDSLLTKYSVLKSAPKLDREKCRIDWTRNSKEIYNQIRGLSPYPGAWSEISNKEQTLIMKIFKSEIVNSIETVENGRIITDKKNYIYVKSGDELISLKELQLQGKKRLQVQDFLRGFDIHEYSFI